MPADRPRRLSQIGPLLALFAGLAACSDGGGDRPITVSVIGPEPVPDGRAATAPQAALASATGLGLIALDGSGQIVPGLAVRWAIEGDGTEIIFRLDELRDMPASRVAKRLRQLLRRSDVLGKRTDVQAVTDSVIELRLDRPRPDVLALLAAPALTALAPDAGPYRAEAGIPGTLRLTARRREDRPAPVILRGERVGRAVVRFTLDQSQAVLGGTFADLPVVRAAEVKRGALRFDDPTGLFGFAIRTANGHLADPAMQEALTLVIDRERIVQRLGAPRTAKATTVNGSTIEAPQEQRRARALSLISRFDGQLAPLRIAVPSGPGAHLLVRLIAEDWARIGISTIVVAPDDADLLLVDRVVPPGERAFAACTVAVNCDPNDPRALLRPPFIPIMAPVRWSLVADRLTGFTENGLAVHPLDQLR